MHSEHSARILTQDLLLEETPPIRLGSLFKRRCFLFAGFLSVSMGVLGIVLPILPTTPFMLLGAYCFARSSKKWHQWLLNHPLFGEYIAAFRNKRGLTIKQKRRIALMVTLMMSISVLHDLKPVMLSVIAIIWAVCMTLLYLCRTAPESADLTSESERAGGVA